MRTFLAIAALGTCLLYHAAMAADPVPAQSAATSQPPDQRGIWAAIAYSEIDAKHGFFWGADRRKEAEKTALDHCRNAGGEACRVVIVFRNHRHWNDDDSGFPYEPCGALAVGEARDGETRSWAADAAPSRREAQDMALEACKGDGKTCRIREWVCT